MEKQFELKAVNGEGYHYVGFAVKKTREPESTPKTSSCPKRSVTLWGLGGGNFDFK